MMKKLFLLVMVIAAGFIYKPACADSFSQIAGIKAQIVLDNNEYFLKLDDMTGDKKNYYLWKKGSTLTAYDKNISTMVHFYGSLESGSFFVSHYNTSDVLPYPEIMKKSSLYYVEYGEKIKYAYISDYDFDKWDEYGHIKKETMHVNFRNPNSVVQVAYESLHLPADHPVPDRDFYEISLSLYDISKNEVSGGNSLTAAEGSEY